jgi:hypothetical protein
VNGIVSKPPMHFVFVETSNLHFAAAIEEFLRRPHFFADPGHLFADAVEETTVKTKKKP